MTILLFPRNYGSYLTEGQFSQDPYCVTGYIDNQGSYILGDT